MKTTLAASILALVASGSFAQDTQPTDDDWYSAGQATIQQMMARQPNTNRAKNVILLIADGNGVGTNYATRVFQGQENGGFGDEHVQPHEAFPYLALVKTYNLNAQTPDSAPTAGQ